MSLAQKIRSKIGSGSKYEEFDEEQLIRIHHILMKEYGWIPLDEYKNLPLPTLNNLLNCISKDKKAEAKEYDKIKSRKR